MIDFLKQLPHLEAYGNPFYFYLSWISSIANLCGSLL